jgi:hypothetical protein
MLLPTAERESVRARWSVNTKPKDTIKADIAQYFGGWGSFNFSIGAVLKKPADWVVQANGNFRESAPIYQCFNEGYYVIWTFYVVPAIQSGSIEAYSPPIL